MIQKIGDMWSIFNITDYFIFTGNSYIKINGAVVMGRGLALDVKKRILGIDMTYYRETFTDENDKMVYLWRVDGEIAEIYNSLSCLTTQIHTDFNECTRLPAGRQG